MASQRSSRQDVVDRLCRDFPQAGSRTIARRLHNEHPAQFPTLDIASQAVRYARGAHGKKPRHNATAPRKLGGLPPLPESRAVEWKPFELTTRRNLIISDLHIPYQSNVAVEAALEWGESFKPDGIVIDGDLWDFYQLSRYDKNPTLEKVSGELRAGKQALHHLRKRFPRARIIFKKGNHDERWDDYMFRVAPLLADMPEIVNGWQTAAGIPENRIEVVGDQRPIMLGKLPVFHGHELGKAMFSPVNPARGAFLRAHHTILVGHSHQTSGHADTNVWHEETFCWSMGCLCDLTPEYARVNRWNWGFAAVSVFKDGSFDVQNMRISKDGKVRAS